MNRNNKTIKTTVNGLFFFLSLFGLLALSHAEGTCKSAATEALDYIDYSELKNLYAKNDIGEEPNVDLLNQNPSLKEDLVNYNSTLADYYDCYIAMETMAINADLTYPEFEKELQNSQEELSQARNAYENAKWKLISEASTSDNIRFYDENYPTSVINN